MERRNSSTKNPKSTEGKDILSYSMNTRVSYKDLRESLIEAGRWMEYVDIVRMGNAISRGLRDNAKFSIKGVKHHDIVTNKDDNERIVLLDPGLRINYDANAEKKERVNAINNLLDDGSINGEITFAHPVTIYNSHWTLVCFKVNLDEARKIRQSKKKDLTVDDLDKIIQGNQYEVNSLKDGRQQDGYSCGIHTMDAFVELCDYGFDEYKKIYEERCRECNRDKVNKPSKNKKPAKKSNHISEKDTVKKSQTNDNSRQFAKYDAKDNDQAYELVKKKETLAKTLGLCNMTKKFLIEYEFFDRDTIESIQGMLDGTNNPDEKKELIRDIKGNIAIAMKEANKQFAKEAGKRGRSSSSLGI